MEYLVKRKEIITNTADEGCHVMIIDMINKRTHLPTI